MMEHQPTDFQPSQPQPVKKKNRGPLIVFAVIGGLAVVCCGVVLGIAGFNIFRARSAYERGHEAFLGGDCETALTEFAIVTEAEVEDYVVQAAPEQEQCQALQDARDQRAAGSDAEALSAYLLYLTAYPDNPLLRQAASAETAELIAGSEPDNLASDTLCGDLTAWTALDVYADPASTVPALYVACADRAGEAGDHESAFASYLFVLEEHGDSPSASQAKNALLDSPVLCAQIRSLLNASLNVKRGFDLATIYLDCGAAAASGSDFETAVSLYEAFLAEYPEHLRRPDAEQGLADALINRARSEGAGEIAPPPLSGSSGAGGTTVIIQNDSPESIRIVFNGPETRIEEIESCPDCEIFSTVGPAFCPEQGPVASFTLLPGVYDVLVESTGSEGTTPFTGTWTLADGDEYSSCFYIVTTFVP
jgi:hypothetical protein